MNDKTVSISNITTEIRISEDRNIALDDIIELYQLNHWSAARKPKRLHRALLNSHSLVSAWHKNRLIALGNAISDGYLVVYYPHLLVLPEFQGKGVGTRVMQTLMEKYHGFHQHILTADKNAIHFYRRCGFEPAGTTQSMWIYKGKDH